MVSALALLLIVPLLGITAGSPLFHAPDLRPSRHIGTFSRIHSPTELRRLRVPDSGNNRRRRGASLLDIRNDGRPAVEVAFGSQSFFLEVDTGSANVWVASSTLTCDPVGSCYFGSGGFEADSSTQPLLEQHFNATYEYGQWANGYVIDESLSFAGITVQGQKVGIVTSGGDIGDGTTSGILGVAFGPSAIYSGSNPKFDGANNRLQYSVVMNTIFDVQGLTSSYFSLALSRDASQTGFGGYLAIGGVPDHTDPRVNAATTFASSPILIDPNFDAAEPSLYTVDIGGVFWYGNDDTTSGSDTENIKFVIDSGAAFSYVTPDTAAAINGLFDPPGSIVDGSWEVGCGATPPSVQYVIGGQAFKVNLADMIHQQSINQGCLSAFQTMSPGGYQSLGDNLFRNTLIVFDWGEMQLHLAARPDYES
ncbi:aspartic peptidase domain-containing protein [Exophiala viscosa]|uniref:aspartic peptidase domain-containing protein n=1 Tax=Exophiala viscosa TaxID=2486360 RepID=UPI002196CDDA|nr:aspartic peptidase domain-containing protein [Exophiala viscosa]